VLLVAIDAEIHRGDVGRLNSGEFSRARLRGKSRATRAVIYTPPDDVPELMLQLVHWLRAESTIHPVLVAGIAPFQVLVLCRKHIYWQQRSARSPLPHETRERPRLPAETIIAVG
jgi:hypothetical protein